MNCKQATNLMSEYVDGTLTIKRAEEIEKHFDECETCAGVLASTRSMLSSLKSLPTLNAPRDCWATVKIHAESKPMVRIFPAIVGRWWRPAMAGVTAAIVGLILAGPVSRPAGPDITARELSELIGVHSRLQRQHSASDPYASFVAAELQKYDVMPGGHK